MKKTLLFVPVIALAVSAVSNGGLVPSYLRPAEPKDIAGCVSWFKLDEASGSRADSVGGNHLTDHIVYASYPVEGLLHPYAANFSGPHGSVRDYLQNSSPTGLYFTSSFSVMLDMYQIAGSDSSDGIVATCYKNGAYAGGGFGISVNNGGYGGTAGRVQFYVYGGDDVTYVINLDSSDAISGKWVRYVFVCDTDAGKLRIYQNGVLKEEAPMGASVKAANGELNVGVNLVVGGGDYYTGRLADLALFNRALHQTAIDTLCPHGRSGEDGDSYDVLYLKNELPSPLASYVFADSSTTNTKTVTANGNAVQLSTVFQNNRTAGFFNGTTDYVVAPNSPDWAFGAGPFTIEMWVMFAGGIDVHQWLCGQNVGGADQDILITGWAGLDSGWDFRLKVGNSYKTLRQYSDPTVKIGVWYHVAFVRDGTSWRCFRDGVEKAVTYSTSPDLSAAVPDFDADLWIGKNPSGIAPYYFNGWIKELRISSVARYPVSFTPSSSPFATDVNTKLLMHFDSPAPSPLGPAIYFDGTGDYLSVPKHADFDFGTDPFTLEMWVNFDTFGDVRFGLMGKMIGNSEQCWGWLISPGASKYSQLYGGTASATVSVPLPQTLVPARWYHLAVSKSDKVRFFIDGVQIGGDQNPAANYDGADTDLWVGAAYGTPNFKGFIREACITRGIAKYTTNFTPSQSGFTTDANTKLYIKGNEDNGSPRSSVPRMTSNTAPAGVASEKNGDAQFFKCFNGSDATEQWFSGLGVLDPATWWGQYQFATPTVVRSYGMKSCTDYRYTPTGWEFQGSHDGGNWTTLDTQSGISWGNLERRMWTVANGTAYSFYRIKTSSGGHAGAFFFTQIYMCDAVSSVLEQGPAPKQIQILGDSTVRYTEDYRSCIFRDETGKCPYPQGGAKVDFFAANGAGVYCGDGATSFLSVPNDPDLRFGTGDWTVEGFLRPSAVSGGVFDMVVWPTGGWGMHVDGNPSLWIANGQTDSNGRSLANAPVTLNTWYHAAMSRCAGVTKVFLNGIEVSSEADTFDYEPTRQLEIGDWFYTYNSARYNYFKGFLDDIRISKGIARYTLTFNPPASEDVSAPVGLLTVSPSNVTFGAVMVGDWDVQYFRVGNGGTASLTGTATGAPPFTVVSGSPYTLASGQTTTVAAVFAPGGVGTYTGAVDFSAGQATVRREVSGEGVPPGDDDHDGMPNYWELRYGLDPTNAVDAAGDGDGDGLSNLQEYLVRTRPDSDDTDGDGATDAEEVRILGTDPAIPDTDGDGMPDGWEAEMGLNPLANDADDDTDDDGLRNLEEYQRGLNPSLFCTGRNGTNDYWAVYGKRRNDAFYDRTDRLVGVQYANGLLAAYRYDGNGNIVGQGYYDRNTQSNGLPMLWRYLNGLSPTDSMGENAAEADPDEDGWTNTQEWWAGTKPLDTASIPDTAGPPGTEAARLSVPFSVSNFVMCAGQLDGQGGEELVMAADGAPGTDENCVLVLTAVGNDNWTTSSVCVGPSGVTSVAVGTAATNKAPAVYAGLRGTNGVGAAVELREDGGGWTVTTIATSSDGPVFVLGAQPDVGVLASLGATNAEAGVLWGVSPSGTVWRTSLLDTNASTRSWGGMTVPNGIISGATSMRVLDGGDVRIGYASGAVSRVLVEPTAASPLLWRGRALASGVVRPGGAASLFYSFIDDQNASGKPDAGDAFTLGEYALVGSGASPSNVVRTTLGPVPLANAYGLAAVKYSNVTNSVFFTGDSDGAVSSWTAAGAVLPMQRRTFSTHYAGMAWHQLEACGEVDGREGLAGLVVDPAAPSTCSVIYWPPQDVLWTPAAVQQTPPTTGIVPDPAEGGGLARVQVRVWDVEGNPALPALQYATNANVWHDAYVVQLDGLAYGPELRVEATPAGTSHEFIWDARRDLGSDFVGSVLLRSRSWDAAGYGEWSRTMGYLASVQPDMVRVTPVAGAHGTIAPSYPIEVPRGSTTSFVVRADTFYHIADLRLNGIDQTVPAGNGCTVTNVLWEYITADGTLGAAFEPNAYSLTIAGGHGVGTPVDGTTWGVYGSNLTCMLTQQTVLEGAGQTQLVAAGWVGTGSVLSSPTGGTTCVVQLTNDSALVWQWQTNVWLDLQAEHGRVDAASGWRPWATNVHVMATANAGYVFSGWTGETQGCVIAGETITIPMTQARSVSAGFASERIGLIIISRNGMAQPPAGVYDHPYRQLVTCAVTNSPVVLGGATQFVCIGWTGAGSAPPHGEGLSTGPFVLTDTSAVAWEWRTDYLLNIVTNGSGRIELEQGAPWVAAGSNFIATAVPEDYFHLAEWRGDTNECVFSSNSVAGMMYSARTLTAVFAPNITSNGVPQAWLAAYGLTNGWEREALLDQDGDGMLAAEEYLADTDPTNRQSVLRLVGVVRTNNGTRLVWRGGQAARQYVERSPVLQTTNGRWLVVFTNLPPTALLTNFLDRTGTNGVLYYRIRASRQ